MYILNIENTKKMTLKDLREFIIERYYRRISFTKEESYFLLAKQNIKLD